MVLAFERRSADREWLTFVCRLVIAQAREKNAQAFAPWTKQEEQEVKRRFEQGESLQHIARTQKRSPRAIELRLQRLGLLPPASEIALDAVMGPAPSER
jgi:DNA-binding NarL/FixJ family response regulator